MDAGGEGDTTGTLNPRGIGKPLIKLGKKAWSNLGGGTGDYYGIGFGYSPLLTDFNCVEIGTLITSTSGQETGDLVFSTRPTVSNVAATERMRITSTGNVGIGTNNPSSLLHVNGSITFKTETWHTSSDGMLRLYFGPGEQTYISGGGSGTNALNLCIVFRRASDQSTISHIRHDGTLMANAYANFSDSRIKKDIEDINDETALNKLLLIQPTTYNYIDVERNKGFGKVYGFIAQQIREVIPEAITITPEIIPNIYKNCLINNKREVYHSIPLDVAIDTEVLITIDKNGGRYKIKYIYKDYFVIDKDIDADEAFVYGYNVNDVMLINKDYIFTLNVCATQELHRRIEAQSVLLKSQEDRIKDLETKVERLINSMNA